VKTVMMLEEGGKVLRRWAAKFAMTSRSQVSFYPAMHLRLECQHVALSVDGARVSRRWVAQLVTGSQWELVTGSE